MGLRLAFGAALALSAVCLDVAGHSGVRWTQTHTDMAPEGSTPDSGCRAVATFADGKTPRRIRHVAVTGSDTTGNGSAARPFRTIARAAERVSPGTAIYVHAGTYAGGTRLADARGTAADPIWIMGAPGEARPVIEGGGEGLHLTRPRYVVIQNLEIRETADDGVNVDDGGDVADAEAARFVLLRDLDVHETGRRPSSVPSCLKLSGLNDVVVVNSRFARCGTGSPNGAVGVNGIGVHRGLVAFSRFEDTGFGGVQVKGGSEDIEIRGNVFERVGARGVNLGGSTGEAFFRPPLSAARLNHEAARIRVVANVFTGGEAAAAFAGCVDCEFNHNTVIDPSRWVLRILQETSTIGDYRFAPSARGVIAGNIFSFRRAAVNAGEDINVGAGTDSSSFRLVQNLWHAHDAPAQSRPRLPAFAGVHTASGVGVDPRFVDVASGDVRLSSESPARGAGTTSLAPASDAAGRCYADPPSLGAMERAAVSQ